MFLSPMCTEMASRMKCSVTCPGIDVRLTGSSSGLYLLSSSPQASLLVCRTFQSWSRVPGCDVSQLSVLMNVSHQSPWTCGPSLPKCPLTQSSLRKRLPSNVPLPRSPACQCRLMQRRCSLTALCASSVTRVPLPFRNRPTLFLGFSKYINNKMKTFLLSLTPFARFNSSRALASQHQ